MSSAVGPAALLLLKGVLLAQAGPVDGSTGIRDLNLPRIPFAPPGSGSLELGPGPSSKAPSGGPKIMVKEVSIQCTDKAALQALVQEVPSRVGLACDFAELEKMTEEMRIVLFKRGFVGVSVWLPRQDVTSGTIVVRVDFPRFGGVTTEKGEVIPSYWLPVFDRHGLVPGATPMASDIEGALLTLERYEGRPVRGVLRPGSADGLVDLSLMRADSAARPSMVFVDNHGSRFTGAWRGGLSHEARGVVRAPDRTALNAVLSEGMEYFGAQYAFFPGSSGMSLGFSMGFMEYEIVEGALAGSGLSGSSQAYSLILSYPLQLSARGSLILDLRADDRSIDEFLAGSSRGDKRITVLSGNLQAVRFSGNVVSQLSAGLSVGRVRQHDPAAAAQDSLGPGIAGGFSKAKVDWTRRQSFGSGILQLGLEAQCAFENLDPSEEMIIGGPYGVRAYPVGEGSIDSGILGKCEWTRGLGELDGVRFQGSVFADLAFLRANADRYSAFVGSNKYALAATGLSLSAENAQGLFFKILISNTLGSNAGADSNGRDADGRASRWRGWLQAGLSF